MSCRLYDMYSEYTVSERAVATVADCVVTSVQQYTVTVSCVVCTICIRSIQLVKEQ